MKAVMYGAGNIGRGFIAQLFSESGFHTTFIDVVDSVVDALNKDGSYPIYVTSGDGYVRTEVSDVSAVNGKDADAVAAAISEADVMATAVGVNILKFIAPPIAAGIRRRFLNGAGPLNVIVCENKIDANVFLRDLIAAELTAEEREYLYENVGFVEASIGRMVPAAPSYIKEKEALAVCVEPFCELPVDRGAFKGEIPSIKGMIPFSPFELYIERKLYMHNMSHAVCAYLGSLIGCEYIWQAAGDPRIRFIALGALAQSASALSAYHGADVRPLMIHAFDLLKRYDNKLLGDTAARVGRDSKRKLAPSDRLAGALMRAKNAGVPYNFIEAGIAAGLLFTSENDPSSDEVCRFAKNNGVERALAEYSCITDPADTERISAMYRALSEDADKALELIAKEQL